MVNSLDTTVRDHLFDSVEVNYNTYKAHVENADNGFVKKSEGDGFGIEVMYRPISYEALLSMEAFDKNLYKASHKKKSQVLSFSVKRIDKRASVFGKQPLYALHIQDDGNGTKLEPVYFIPDHKLGQTEVFYIVFDRKAVSEIAGDFLHLVWTDQYQTMDLYYTKRILKKDFILIQDVD
ncbi:MAG TPA: hypothetical protein VL947_06395 [Cytophagales bacterium]|nr:hypothetical protein [Cytophagales bacterium]